MADKAIVLEWGTPITGREFKALEVFGSTVAYFTQLQEKGKVERFNTYGNLSGNMTERSGFLLVEGSSDQIDNLLVDEEWRSRFTEIVTIGNNIRMNTFETGDEMQKRMERYGKSVKKIVG